VPLIFSGEITYLLLGGEYNTEFLLIVITSMTYALRSVPLGILRLKHQAWKFVVVSMVNFSLYLIITYILISYYHFDYFGFLYGGLISILISFFVGLIFIRKYIGFSFNFQLAIRMLKFGLGILTTSLTVILIANINRIFLKFNSGFEEIAILGMASRISVIVGALLVAPFNLAWLPYINKIQGEENFKGIIQKIYQVFSFIGINLSVWVSLFSYYLLNFSDDKSYLISVDYIPIFSFGYVVLGFYYIFSSGIYLSRETRKYVYITIATLSINLILYLVFFDRLNVLNTSLITVSGYLIMALVSYYMGRETTGINIFDTKVLMFFVLSIGLIFPVIKFNLYSNFISSLGISLFYLIISMIILVDASYIKLKALLSFWKA